MNNKIFFVIFVFVFLLGSLHAQSFPSNGNDTEKQKWILENPDKIDLRDSEQKTIVENYLVNKGAISANIDRKFLEDLIRYNTLDKIQIDFSKGQGISLKKENNNLFLVSSDGQKHDIAGFNSLNVQGKKLEKIQSRDDGTIDLFFGEDSIHLKGNTIKTDTLGQLILNDGTILDLKPGFGKLDIQGNSIACSSVKCAFSIGFMEFELNQDGIFNNHGSNKFSVLGGKTKIGNDLLSGNFKFSTDEDGKNLGNKVEMGKINDEAKNTESFIQTDSKYYGKTEIRSSSGDKVVACFDCTDFIKHVEKYDGYVDLKKQTQLCSEFETCNNYFKAEMKGKITAKFENDVEHFGSDKNLLLTFDSNPNQAKINLISCEGCQEGSISSEMLNGKRFQIFNEIDENKQDFSVLQTNVMFPKEGIYERRIDLIYDTGEINNFYSINPDSSVKIDKITPQDVEDYKIYNNLNNERAKKGLNVYNKLPEIDKKNFATFLKNMRGGADGEIVLAGELPSVGGKPYPLGNGDYISIRNPETQKCIDEERCNLEDIVELAKANREVVKYEKEKTVKAFLTALVPQSFDQAVFDGVTNLATAGFGKVGAVGFALTHAGSELRAARVLMNPLWREAGVKAGTIPKFDELLTALPKNVGEKSFTVTTNQGRREYLNSLAAKVAEETGLPAKEVKAFGLEDGLFKGGYKGENFDTIAFVHESSSGEVTPFVIGTTRYSSEQVSKQKLVLNSLSEEFGRNYGFKGVLTHNTRDVATKQEVEGYTVLVGDLPSETQAKVVQSYEEYYRINGISNDLNGFAEGTESSLKTAPRVISSEAKQSVFPKLPEIDTKFQGFVSPGKSDFGLSGNPKSLGIYDKTTGENVGDIRYTIQDNILEINQIGIFPEKRGNKYSSAAISKVLDENPDVTKIVGRLEESNKRRLMETAAELLGENGKIKVSSDSVDLQFNRCCAKKLRSLSEGERDSLLKSAAESTFFYQSASRRGFNKICGINYIPEELYRTRVLIQICK